MNKERIYKTDVTKITDTMNIYNRTKFVNDIITIFRENANHQVLGSKIEGYVIDTLGKESEDTFTILDNWDERD